MYSKAKGTCQHDEIPFVDMSESAGCRHAQQVQPEGRRQHTQPDEWAYLLAQDPAEDRHQHDIEGGYEPGLACSGVHHADLLQHACHQQCQPAAYASCYQELLIVLFIHLRKGGVCCICFYSRSTCLFLRFHPVKDHDKRDQHNTSDYGTYTVEREGTDELHAAFLGNERAAPDHGCQHKHQITF